MPVIVLTEGAQHFLDPLIAFFSEKLTVLNMTGSFKSVRSSMASLTEDTLYIVPGLSKPERYEIFCLARKNNQQFITLATTDGASAGDRNILLVDQFDGDLIWERLMNSRLAPTIVNKRSKGVSLKGLGELKRLINRVNGEYEQSEANVLILKECEERMVKIWNFNNQCGVEEAEECYRAMVEGELKRR